jgi:integrase
MKYQKGYIWRVGRTWFGRWYQDEIKDGKVVRVQHSERLCEYSNRYRSRKDVQPLLDRKLQPLNDRRATPEGTLTVAKYGDDHFLPYAERELKPSTTHGYKALWKMYLRPRVSGISLRDFRCVDATNLLAAIHRDHNLSRLTLRHCKALLSTIFTHAKRAGVIDGLNPVQDAGIPKAAVKSDPTHAYSADQVLAMLDALDGIARATVAVMFFCGLRPSEARAIEWTDYDGDRGVLKVRASMWHTHLTPPKTEESCGVVPVANMLAEILSELPHSSKFILAGPSGKPVDLHNLAARVVKPSLKRCKVCKKVEGDHEGAGHDFELDKSIPTWRGWYALRRGLATLATSVDSALAAKSLLRHANIATTNQHYIKSVAADALRAMDKINALVDNANGSGRPN